MTWHMLTANAIYISQLGARNITTGFLIAFTVAPILSYSFRYLKNHITKQLHLVILFEAICIAALIILIFVHENNTLIRAYYVFAMVTAIILRSLTWNLLPQYFNIFELKKIYPYFTAAQEFGSVSIALLYFLKLVPVSITVGFYVSIGATIIHLGLLTTLYKKRVISYTTITDKDKHLGLIDRRTRKLLILLSSLLALYIISKIGMQYQLNIAVEHLFHDTEKIAAGLGLLSILSSAAVATFSLLVGPYIFKYSSSTKIIIYIISFSLILFVVPIIYTLPLIIVIAEIARRISEHLLLVPSYEQIVSTFVGRVRSAIKLIVDAQVAPLAALVGSVILLFTHIPGVTQRMALSIYLPLLVGALVLAFILRRFYYSYHKENIHSKDRDIAISSIQALGEYDNFMAIGPLLTLLKNAEKQTIKKNIILSLGMIAKNPVLYPLLDQVKVNNEELQLAAVESLSHFKSYSVANYLLEFIQSNNCQSFHSRRKIILVLHKLLGSSIVPTLMHHLHNHDPRVIANTIESFEFIKDKRIIEVLSPFLFHENNRVKANTILCLYKFKMCRERCSQTLTKMLLGEGNEALSAFYIIGRLRAVELLNIAKKVYLKKYRDIRVRINYAFMLLNCHQKGADALLSTIMTSGNDNEIKACLHHFLQLSPQMRLKVVDRILSDEQSSKHHPSGATTAAIVSALNRQNYLHLYQLMKASPYDFHTELSIMKKVLFAPT